MKKSILFSITIVVISVFSAASVKAQSKGMTQSSDAFGVGTNVISAGIGLVWAGETWNLPWLAYADSIAGLAVAGFAARV